MADPCLSSPGTSGPKDLGTGEPASGATDDLPGDCGASQEPTDEEISDGDDRQGGMAQVVDPFGAGQGGVSGLDGQDVEALQLAVEILAEHLDEIDALRDPES